jgi:hypothetical protein
VRGKGAISEDSILRTDHSAGHSRQIESGRSRRGQTPSSPLPGKAHAAFRVSEAEFTSSFAGVELALGIAELRCGLTEPLLVRVT